jgi:NADPH:quinone reductase-like Zn-dependent oxidoreductase
VEHAICQAEDRPAGYEHVIDLSNESMKDGVLRITDGKGVDVVVDGVSGNLIAFLFAATLRRGRDFDELD